MTAEFTVSQLSALIKKSLEINFGAVKLTAEVSALKVHSSGHAYFSLKDEYSVIDAICWKWTLQKHRHQLENGLKITCCGKVSSYSAQSKYQFIVEKFELVGIGNLLKILEDRKKKLEAEGLFAVSHKKPIPKIPKIIGVITSPTGAVIRDILHRVKQRFPTNVLVWPVLVQGSEASEQVEKALDGMNALPTNVRPNVLIVARGGGSFEDLMPFNEENVVRAVYRSKIPVVSAVGHETDTTLIDYAADLRAPTPTAAAEFVTPERMKLSSDLDLLFAQISRAMGNNIEKKRLCLTSNKMLDIFGLLSEKLQRLDFCSERLRSCIVHLIDTQKMSLSKVSVSPPVFKFDLDETLSKVRFAFLNLIKNYKHRLILAENTLESCSHISILRKGFAIAESENHRPITSAKEATLHSKFFLTFADGRLKVRRELVQTDLFSEN